MKIDPTNMDYKSAHHLIVGIVVPRPIAWVSTVGTDGTLNLAPFSMFAPVCMQPPYVGFSASRKRDGQKKDTLRNIESTGEFVINVVDETLVDKMVLTSAPFPADVSEFKEAALTPGSADLVKVPMVAESPVNIECRLDRILEFGEAPRKTSFIIGKVLLVHVRDDIWADGEVQISRLKAVGRLGGELHCRLRDVFETKLPPDL